MLAAFASVGAAAAASGPPCARALLQDWADGGIDRAYKPSCYRRALKELPADLRVYSSAPDDIRNALARQVAHRATRRLTAYGVAGARHDERSTASTGTPLALIILGVAAGSLFVGLAVAVLRR